MLPKASFSTLFSSEFPVMMRRGMAWIFQHVFYQQQKAPHLFHTLPHPVQGFTQLPAIQTDSLCSKISGIFLIFMLLSPTFLDIYAFVSQIFFNLTLSLYFL